MDGDDAVLTLAEVCFDEGATKPFGYNDPFVIGSSLEDIHELVVQFEEATRKPILSYPADFDIKPDEDISDFADAEMGIDTSFKE